jgi:hypothetical protein
MMDQSTNGPSGAWAVHSSSQGQKTMTDLLALPDPERRLMNWLMRRRQASLAELLNQIGGSVESAQGMVEQLLQAGFLSTLEKSEGSGEMIFKPKLVSRRN